MSAKKSKEGGRAMRSEEAKTPLQAVVLADSFTTVSARGPDFHTRRRLWWLAARRVASPRRTPPLASFVRLPIGIFELRHRSGRVTTHRATPSVAHKPLSACCALHLSLDFPPLPSLSRVFSSVVLRRQEGSQHTRARVSSVDLALFFPDDTF